MWYPDSTAKWDQQRRLHCWLVMVDATPTGSEGLGGVHGQGGWPAVGAVAGAHDFRHTYRDLAGGRPVAALLSTSGVMTAGVPQADGNLRLEPQI